MIFDYKEREMILHLLHGRRKTELNNKQQEHDPAKRVFFDARIKLLDRLSAKVCALEPAPLSFARPSSSPFYIGAFSSILGVPVMRLAQRTFIENDVLVATVLPTLSRAQALDTASVVAGFLNASEPSKSSQNQAKI